MDVIVRNSPGWCNFCITIECVSISYDLSGSTDTGCRRSVGLDCGWSEGNLTLSSTVSGRGGCRISAPT